LFRRNPWLIGLVIKGISYSPGMPAQPSSDVRAQNSVHYVTEASVLVPL